MATISDILFNVGAYIDALTGATVTPRATFNQSLAVAQVEPPNLEATRAGRRFILGNIAPVTGIAPVQALPTTAAQWVLWNTDTTYAMFFEELGMYLTSGTAGVGGYLLAAVVPPPATAIVGPTYTGTAISNCAGAASARSSKLFVKASATLAVAPNWYPVTDNVSPNVGAFPGSGTLFRTDLGGKLAVAPGYGLALAVVALAGSTPLFAPRAMWYEAKNQIE